MAVLFIIIFFIVSPLAKELRAQGNSTNNSPQISGNGTVLVFNHQWSIRFSGQISAFFTNFFFPSVEHSNLYSIQNGVVPGILSVHPTYKPNKEITITANLGVWLGLASITNNINSFSNTNHEVDFSPIDIRNISVDIDTPYGSVLFGRDFGLFALDAFENDISLLGVGANRLFGGHQYTALGGIGYGYIYCDRLNQINYTTPTFSGTTITLGLYQSLPFPNSTISKSFSVGGQARITSTHKLPKNINLYFSMSGILQEQFMGGYQGLENSFIAGAGDAFLKIKIFGFDLMGYLYVGSNVGNGTLFNFRSSLTNDNALPFSTISKGYYAQAVYTIPISTPITLSFNYGLSSILYIGSYEISSRRLAASISCNLLPSLKVRIEYTNQTDQVFLGEPESDIIAAGATFSF